MHTMDRVLSTDKKFEGKWTMEDTATVAVADIWSLVIAERAGLDRRPGDDVAIEHMKDIFLSVLPIATGVITYWFVSIDRGAGRESESSEPRVLS